MMNEPQKAYCPPVHTAEHILNQAMNRMFGCGRAFSAHIEVKKSKCDYHFPKKKAIPTDEQIICIAHEVNSVIQKHLDVTTKMVTREEALQLVDLSRLPPDADGMLRLVLVGDYDICACIGQHVANTSEIGTFTIISHDYENGVFRLRWKISILSPENKTQKSV